MNGLVSFDAGHFTKKTKLKHLSWLVLYDLYWHGMYLSMYMYAIASKRIPMINRFMLIPSYS